MKDKMIVGLCGAPVNSGNLGCQALAYSTVKLMYDIAGINSFNLEVYVFESNPSNERCAFMCEKMGIPKTFVSSYKSDYVCVLPSYRKYFKTNVETISRLKKCNVIFDFTEGDSFSDIYGRQRLNNTLKLKNLILKMRVPLVLAPQTYGPYNNSSSKKNVCRLLKKVDYIVARDMMSAKVVNDLCGRSALVTSDVAFGLPYNTTNIIKDGKIHIGVNISGLLVKNKVEATKAEFMLATDYDEYIYRILDYLSSSDDYSIYLIPHVEEDYVAMEKIKSDFDKTHLVQIFNNPLDVKSFISSMDVFIGARMHATIAAYSSGVYTIPTAYSRKFKGVFDLAEITDIVDLLNEDTETSVNKTIELIKKYKTGNSGETKDKALALQISTQKLFSEILLTVVSDKNDNI